MRIAVISDTHFGYAWGTEREDDSFRQAAEALQEADADIILMPGDVFDTRVPRQEVMERAMRVLSIPLERPGTGVVLEDTINKDARPVTWRAFTGIPVVAIHGTHERRGSGLANPLQTLEAAGMLVHLHCQSAILRKGDERVAFHGMSGVPESYAPEVLEGWAPKPVENAINIFVLHQSFKETVFADAAFLTLASLPPGFDLYVNGHVHNPQIFENQSFLQAGSTITTQLRDSEAKQPKGYFVIDTVSRSITFFPIKSQRPLFYIELSFDNAEPRDVVAKARQKIGEALHGPFELKPLVKLKLKGSLSKGAMVDTAEIRAGFDALVFVDNDLSAGSFRKRMAELREMHNSKLSVDEIGLKLLEESLKQADYKGPDAHQLFAILAEGDIEKAMQLILRK
jgi:DNA repair exonuclease SbcCD nuclease subunit